MYSDNDEIEMLLHFIEKNCIYTAYINSYVIIKIQLCTKSIKLFQISGGLRFRQHGI